MIFLMDCFTLSEAMSSSATRRIDELKKYFSSNSPCGVCTYLLVVTREMVLSCMPTWSAMSRRIIGRRNIGPFSKKSRCRSTIDSVTRMIVLRRCSMARISHCAFFSFSPTYSFAFGSFRSRFARTSLMYSRCIPRSLSSTVHLSPSFVT